MPSKRFGSRRRGPFGDKIAPGPPEGAIIHSTELAQAVVPSVEAETPVTSGDGGGDGGGGGSTSPTTEQEATSAVVGPPKPKPKQTKLVAAGTFSLPGTGRAAALRSPGLIRGRIGPPARPFSGRKRRRRKTEAIPDKIGAYGSVAARDASNAGFQLNDDEYAKILAGKVISGGM